MDFLRLVVGALKRLSADDFEVTGSIGQGLKVTSFKRGVDLARGPWVKFGVEEAARRWELQAYKTWAKGDRIKFGTPGNLRETDQDEFDVTASAAEPENVSAVVILKMRFELDGLAYAFRFAGELTPGGA